MDKKKIYKYPVSWEHDIEGDGEIIHFKALTQLYQVGVYLILYMGSDYRQYNMYPSQLESIIKRLREDKGTLNLVEGRIIHVQEVDGLWKDVTPVEV